MNRKDRRRLKKHGGSGSQPAADAPRRGGSSVSAMLLHYAGQDASTPIDPAALEIVAQQAKAGPVDAAFAKLRRREILNEQVRTIERALASNSRSVELLHTLAKLHRHLDDRAGALSAYRRLLAAAPDRADVRHMIAALSGAPGAPARADDAFVAAEFDGFADGYDSTMVNWLEYRGPEVVSRAVASVLGANPPPQDAVDLGCGTGLNGAWLREIARRLDGVDLSAKMIAKARARRVYDTLVVEEIGRFLAQAPQRYTLAIAADVLIYFGELAPVFGAVAAALRPGGIFAFTVEAGAGEPFRLMPTGRYVHDDDYVRAAAASAGFTIARATDETVRKERLQPVHGRCYVLSKPA